MKIEARITAIEKSQAAIEQSQAHQDKHINLLFSLIEQVKDAVKNNTAICEKNTKAFEKLEITGNTIIMLAKIFSFLLSLVVALIAIYSFYAKI